MRRCTNHTARACQPCAPGDAMVAVGASNRVDACSMATTRCRHPPSHPTTHVGVAVLPTEQLHRAVPLGEPPLPHTHTHSLDVVSCHPPPATPPGACSGNGCCHLPVTASACRHVLPPPPHRRDGSWLKWHQCGHRMPAAARQDVSPSIPKKTPEEKSPTR